jgi:hypothetical protein
VGLTTGLIGKSNGLSKRRRFAVSSLNGDWRRRCDCVRFLSQQTVRLSRLSSQRERSRSRLYYNAVASREIIRFSNAIHGYAASRARYIRRGGPGTTRLSVIDV